MLSLIASTSSTPTYWTVLSSSVWLILTAWRVRAAEGLALGLVNEVAPADQLMTVARRWAEEIMGLSPMSLRASKEIVRNGLATANIAEAYAAQKASPAVRALFKSADMREGPLAFAQKRLPRWTGK